MKASILIAIVNLIFTITVVTDIAPENRIVVAIILVAELIIFPVLMYKLDNKELAEIGILSYCILLYFILVNYVDDYQFTSAWNWKIAIIISLIYSSAVIILLKKAKHKKFIFVIYITIALFSFVSILSIVNVELDNREIEISKVIVCDKGYVQIYSFHTAYEFLVKGDIEGHMQWISVPYDIYKLTDVGTSIDVCIGKGLFDKTYYYYRNCKYKKYIVDRKIIVTDENFYEYLDTQKKI